MNRSRTLVIVIAVAVVATLGGWLAGSQIKTAAEVAARTAPPTPSAILVPIEKRALTADIVARGTARFGSPRAISIAASALKSNASLITSLPTLNKSLKEGDVAMIASERPVFILQGDLPVYRDLGPGLSGDDVRQFEEALKRLGFNPGPVDGTFDARTEAAVAAWYTSAGWQPFKATPDQIAEIRALEQELTKFNNDKLSADDAVSAAMADLAAAKATYANAVVDSNTAPKKVASARASADAANEAAVADVTAKTAIVNEVIANPTSTDTELANARADLAAAKAAEKAAKKAGEAAVQEAINAQAAASRDVDTTKEAVKSAEQVLRSAQSQRSNTGKSSIVADLAASRRKAGVQVPANEILFVPSLPVLVEKIDAAIGDEAKGPIMTVTNSKLEIDASLPLDEAKLIKPGMAVTIDEPDLGITETGFVERVADAPGTDGVDAFHVYFEVSIDGTNTALVGVSVRLTIPIKSTSGKVIAVPVSALSLTTNGTSRVQIDDKGTLRFIEVKPGLSAKGYVEVTPADGTLTPDQHVVIGFKGNKQ